jgi:hypothetical protein
MSILASINLGMTIPFYVKTYQDWTMAHKRTLTYEACHPVSRALLGPAAASDQRHASKRTTHRCWTSRASLQLPVLRRVSKSFQMRSKMVTTNDFTQDFTIQSWQKWLVSQWRCFCNRNAGWTNKNILVKGTNMDNMGWSNRNRIFALSSVRFQKVVCGYRQKWRCNNSLGPCSSPNLGFVCCH